ncbi:MAG: peptidoglycan DD-metalloendopeptidase family protein [Pseudomonadota bacterium]
MGFGERVLSRVISPREIAVTTSAGTRTYRLGAPAQALGAASVIALLGWSTFATVDRFVGQIETPVAGAHGAVLRSAYERRIEEIMVARDAALAGQEELRAQLDDAVGALGQYHDQLAERSLAEAEYATAGAALSDRLAEQNQAVATLRAELAEAQTALAAREAEVVALATAHDDVSRALGHLAGGLKTAARANSTLEDQRGALADEVTRLQDDLVLTEQRHERVMSRIEGAVQANLDMLEGVFARSGADLDGILATVRDQYSGTGGPDLPVLPGDDEGASLTVDPDQARLQELLFGLDRLNLMTVASRNVPFATPVTAGYRQTSGFGPRRDPINRRTRMHNGLDFAAPVGTPILAPADGVVVTAETQRGFGKVIKIRHDFGYETLYAHLNRMRVRVGDSVTRGDRIGDMGSTGRSTGSHLHYEVHLGGKPVDPLNYLKAARNVL